MVTTAVDLIEFIAGLHPVLQFLAVFTLDVAPHLESCVGAFVGTLTGIPVVLAGLVVVALAAFE